MGRLQSKIAMITGAAGGIGAGIAAAFAAEGARVAVIDIDGDGARRHADQLRAKGFDATGFGADIGDAVSIEILFRHVIETFGGIDILCNNAAATQLAANRDGAVADMDIDVWDDTLRINLRGTMLMCKFAIPYMRQRGGGSIINVASASSRAGSLANTAYGISKAGIAALTEYVATQCGRDGIRCNTLSPVYIVTPARAPLLSDATRNLMLKHNLTNRLGRVEDIAAAAVYLAADESGYVTGHQLCIDGGALAHQPYYGDLLGHGDGRVSK
jgi:NAD(P)-dependent dehydrogenase (short-subunit alcohol dehydrogenase family)